MDRPSRLSVLHSIVYLSNSGYSTGKFSRKWRSLVLSFLCIPSKKYVSYLYPPLLRRVALPRHIHPRKLLLLKGKHPTLCFLCAIRCFTSLTIWLLTKYFFRDPLIGQEQPLQEFGWLRVRKVGQPKNISYDLFLRWISNTCGLKLKISHFFAAKHVYNAGSYFRFDFTINKPCSTWVVAPKVF